MTWLSPSQRKLVIQWTRAQELGSVELVQKLWSNMGSLLKVQLKGSPIGSSAIVKAVDFSRVKRHPRGWNTSRSFERKARSYEVEEAFYRSFTQELTANCRTARFLGAQSSAEQWIMVLEDLDAAGFPIRRQSLSDNELRACLRWLAEFHAQNLGRSPQQLWPIGCYWHLDTRPDEFDAMEEDSLKHNARSIDQKLNSARFQTLVHGDAKVANFCFARDSSVAAVDFQYVGAGIGMKDLAYFLGSCLTEQECEQREEECLDLYFEFFESALSNSKPMGSSFGSFDELEQEWRALYPMAWADFHRFLLGWMPRHWKAHGYSEHMVHRALRDL